MSKERVIDVVAREIAAAAAAGGSITGKQIADMHGLDAGDVAKAIRQLFARELIRGRRDRPIEATMPLIDDNGFIKRGGQRASLRKLLDDGPLTHRECSDEMRQNYIEMSMLDSPLVDVNGDEIFITDAGRKALTGYWVGEVPKDAGGEAKKTRKS